MNDAVTKKPIKVLTTGTAKPYIEVPEQQLDAVTKLLADHAVRHWVSELVISLDDEPATGMIILGADGDAKKVQDLLNAAP